MNRGAFQLLLGIVLLALAWLPPGPWNFSGVACLAVGAYFMADGLVRP